MADILTCLHTIRATYDLWFAIIPIIEIDQLNWSQNNTFSCEMSFVTNDIIHFITIFMFWALACFKDP